VWSLLVSSYDQCAIIAKFESSMFVVAIGGVIEDLSFLLFSKKKSCISKVSADLTDFSVLVY